MTTRTAADLLTEDDHSRHAWAANAADVAAHPEAASTRNLRRAIHFLDHVRIGLIHRAEKAGVTVHPEVILGYLNEIAWYVRIIATRERLERARHDRMIARIHDAQTRDHRPRIDR